MELDYNMYEIFSDVITKKRKRDDLRGVSAESAIAEYDKGTARYVKSAGIVDYSHMLEYKRKIEDFKEKIDNLTTMEFMRARNAITNSLCADKLKYLLSAVDFIESNTQSIARDFDDLYRKICTQVEKCIIPGDEIEEFRKYATKVKYAESLLRNIYDDLKRVEN